MSRTIRDIPPVIVSGERLNPGDKQWNRFNYFKDRFHRGLSMFSELLCVGENTMLWTIVALLLVLWLLGFSFSIGGSLIHLLLVAGLIVLVFNLLSGRRSAV